MNEFEVLHQKERESFNNSLLNNNPTLRHHTDLMMRISQQLQPEIDY